MRGTLCAYSVMRLMVHRIEKYNSEKLFDESDMIFLMLQENKLHGSVEEALFAIDRFPEEINLL